MATIKLKHEDYESGKIDVLFQVVQNAHNTGQRQDYQIAVDDFTVIPRTSNPELFGGYADFVSADTKKITVTMYKGASPSNDKYFFHIKGVPEKEQTVNGISEDISAEEIEKKQKEKLLREIRYEELEKENEELYKELEEKENALAELAENFKQLKEGKLIGFGEIGSSVLMGILKHPMIQENFPVLQGLGFTQEKENTTDTQSPQQESASFSRMDESEKNKNENEQVADVLTDEERRYLILIHDLQKKLNPFQLPAVMNILDLITTCPSAIGSTQKHIHNFINGYVNKTNTHEKV